MATSDDAELEARIRDQRLQNDGPLDPGQPTETVHKDHVRRMRSEFSPTERRLIRDQLFGGPIRE